MKKVFEIVLVLFICLYLHDMKDQKSQTKKIAKGFYRMMHNEQVVHY